MARTVDAMTETVNTLLLLARRPEQLAMGSLDLRALVRDQADAAALVCARRGLGFRADVAPGVTARGHAGLATLVARNLADNALRYTEAGEVALTLDSGGLTVADSAPPIAEDVRAHV